MTTARYDFSEISVLVTGGTGGIEPGATVHHLEVDARGHQDIASAVNWGGVL